MNDIIKMLEAALVSIDKRTNSNSRAIESMAALLAAQAYLIVSSLEKCSKEDCNEPATVVNEHISSKMCDRCAATTIVSTREKLVNKIEKITQVTSACSLEMNWQDIQNAESIRKLTAFLYELERLKLSQPADTVTLH